MWNVYYKYHFSTNKTVLRKIGNLKVRNKNVEQYIVPRPFFILDRLSIRTILPSYYRLYSDALVTPITSPDSVVIMEIVSVMRRGGRWLRAFADLRGV